MKATNVLLTMAIGVSLQANAIDILDHESIPSYYATVQKHIDEETREETFTISYKQDAVAWRAPALDRVLRSYGVELVPEIAGDLPGDFASVVQVEKQPEDLAAELDGAGAQQIGMTEVEYNVNFGTGGVAWRPAALNRVFAAYNLVPDLDNFDDVPSGYGKVVEVEETVVDEQTGEESVQTVKKLQLKDDATFWRAGMLHRILSGYKKGDPSAVASSAELAAQ